MWFIELCFTMWSTSSDVYFDFKWFWLDSEIVFVVPAFLIKKLKKNNRQIRWLYELKVYSFVSLCSAQRWQGANEASQVCPLQHYERALQIHVSTPSLPIFSNISIQFDYWGGRYLFIIYLFDHLKVIKLRYLKNYLTVFQDMFIKNPTGAIPIGFDQLLDKVQSYFGQTMCNGPCPYDQGA